MHLVYENKVDRIELNANLNLYSFPFTKNQQTKNHISIQFSYNLLLHHLFLYLFYVNLQQYFLFQIVVR
jgi:hypothetical protein